MDYQASKERSWCFFYYIKHTHSGLEGTFRERVEGAVWEFPQMYNSKNAKIEVVVDVVLEIYFVQYANDFAILQGKHEGLMCLESVGNF